jgi:hypothetical protein
VTRIRRLAALALAAVTASAALAGCSSTVSLSPAPHADDPACAEVTVRLPDSLDGQQRRWTDAQATAAWGNPASVLLTCGVDPPGPTTLPCKSANGVDWIIDSSRAPRYRVTTFGRKPAVQIYLDNRVVSSADVLDALSTIVSVLPTDGQVCTPSN